jgi:cyclase
MLKLRIIPTLLFDGITLVKGKKFQSWRTVSTLVQQVRIYALRGVDEMILLDIAATNNKEKVDLNLIKDITQDVFMPFTVGGGIKKTEDINNLLSCGADKVAINTAGFENPHFIKEAVRIFGSQCIIISVDYKKIDNEYIVFTYSGKNNTGTKLFDYLNSIRSLNIGEILLTSIDRDGTMEGYDVEVIKKVNELMDMPIIASGGAKNYQDMLNLIKSTNVTALAAASIYHFKNQTPKKAKIFLKENSINVRI